MIKFNYMQAIGLTTALPVFLLVGCGQIESTDQTRVSAVKTSMTASSHPRLILNAERIGKMRSSMTTTHEALWKQALKSADNFASETIPSMANAHNSYRGFGDTMPVLGLAYRLTGDKKYVDAANRWLQAFLDVPEWSGSQNLGRSAWVVGSAFLYDWLHDELPEKTMERLRERLVTEGDIMLEETSYWRLLSNHCLIETAALGMIGLALDGEHGRAQVFLDKARERTDLIIEHAPLDGSWGEGVQYWQYGLGYFLRYLEASKAAGHHDYYSRYDWLKKTGFFPIYFSLPSDPTKSVNFGDSGESSYVNAFLMYLPASVYRNGYFQDFANKVRSESSYKFSWMDFIAYDPTVQPVDYTTLPAYKHFTDNGFIIMRSSWAADATLVGFRCGPGPGHRNQVDPRRLERRGFGPGHGHPDINSFSLFAYGKWLALDAGYVYEKWTHDHNTVLVNGRGQAGEGEKWLDYMAFQNREPAPAILRADNTPEYDYIIGDAGNVYVEEAGVEHFRRHLLFLKPNTVVILDDLKGKKPSKFQWLMQAYDQAKQTGKDEFEILRDGVRLWVRPIMPAGYKPTISAHELEGSATNGKITTLDFSIGSREASTFLVVLSALPDAKALAPTVEYKNGLLKINHLGKSWDIEVKQATLDADGASPLLNVK